MSTDPFACRCGDDTLEDQACVERASQEDGLCDDCRANCGANRVVGMVYTGPLDGHCNRPVGTGFAVDGAITLTEMLQ